MSDCLFCKMAAGEITPDIVYQDDEILAFRDINPKAPTHILIIPKKHIPSVAEAQAEDIALLGKIQLVAAQLAEELGLKAGGFRLVSNAGKNAGQEVFHLHYHLIGGAPLGIYW